MKLCEGLEQIDCRAFQHCISLEQIIISTTVKVIGASAFEGCIKLMNVKLCEGLERISNGAFQCCSSLEQIIIPTTVKVIGGSAFKGCIKLMNVKLCEGLEQIDCGAFQDCTSLKRIIIPSTVSCINENAFKGCSGLVSVAFCEEMKQLVKKLPIPWWGPGKSRRVLRTYSSLAQYNIPVQLATIKVLVWKSNIHKILQRILVRNKTKEKALMRAYTLIESQLSMYKHLQNAASILELALWKSKMEEQVNDNILDDQIMKWQCRFDSLSMVPIIIPNALSFL